MAVKGTDIISMIVGNEDLTIVRIIQESSILKFKLQNSKKQSWYFQKASNLIKSSWPGSISNMKHTANSLIKYRSMS